MADSLKAADVVVAVWADATKIGDAPTRKIAVVTLTLWKRGKRFDELKLSEQAA